MHWHSECGPPAPLTVDSVGRPAPTEAQWTVPTFTVCAVGCPNWASQRRRPVHASIFMHTYMHMHMHMYMYMCMCICMYVCMKIDACTGRRLWLAQLGQPTAQTVKVGTVHCASVGAGRPTLSTVSGAGGPHSECQCTVSRARGPHSLCECAQRPTPERG